MLQALQGTCATLLDMCVCVCVCVCIAYSGVKYTLVIHHASYQTTVLCTSIKSLSCQACVKSSICEAGVHLSLNYCCATGLFLFAAGNNGQLTDSPDITQQFFPAGYGLANQISVGASDTTDGLAAFSNYGA